MKGICDLSAFWETNRNFHLISKTHRAGIYARFAANRAVRCDNYSNSRKQGHPSRYIMNHLSILEEFLLRSLSFIFISSLCLCLINQKSIFRASPRYSAEMFDTATSTMLSRKYVPSLIRNMQLFGNEDGKITRHDDYAACCATG